MQPNPAAETGSFSQRTGASTRWVNRESQRPQSCSRGALPGLIRVEYGLPDPDPVSHTPEAVGYPRLLALSFSLSSTLSKSLTSEQRVDLAWHRALIASCGVHPIDDRMNRRDRAESAWAALLHDIGIPA